MVLTLMEPFPPCANARSRAGFAKSPIHPSHSSSGAGATNEDDNTDWKLDPGKRNPKKQHIM